MTESHLWGAHFSREEINAARDQGRLLTLELELSMICNLRCIYCYAEAGAPLEGELSLGEIYDTLAQAKDLGAKRIIILGGGEPMLYPAVMDIMRHIRDQGLVVDLFTNGMAITPEIARELFAMGVWPVVKMNSLRPEVQDHLAGMKGACKDIRAGLQNLRDAGYPRPGRPLGVQSVICRQNLEELPEMWTWARDRDLVPYFEMITFQGRARRHPELQVSLDEVRELFETLSALDREKYGIHWEPTPPIAGLTCSRHEYSCTVTCQGKVIPCPGVNVAVGDIRRRPLKDILATSPVIRQLRGIRRNIKGACQSCDKSDRCYGCRGLSFQTTGDYLASDPLCWKNPDSLCPMNSVPELPAPAHLVIPHRPPMLLVDRLLSCGDKAGEAEAEVRPDWPLVDEDGELDSVALVELLAQSYALVRGYEALLAGSAMREGFLVGMRKMETPGRAAAGDRLRVTVRTEADLEGFAVASGEVRRGDEILAQGSIKVYTPTPEELQARSPKS